MIPPQKVTSPNSAQYPIVNDGMRFLQILLICLIICLIFGLSWRVKAAVLVTNVPSLSENAVQSAINSALPGEEINLPAGTVVWTTSLVITNNISLIGAGAGNTVVVDNNSTSGLILWNTISNYTQCNLSGFTIEDSSSQGGRANDVPEVEFRGFCPVCHVTGCRFDNLYNVGVEFYDGTYGCIDHCQFDTTNFANQILCYNGALGGFEPNNEDGENEYGDISYATPVQYGSTNWWIYIEACGFSYTGPNLWSAVNDARAGTRVVFRGNWCTNMFFQFHGTETSGRIRGGRACEIYNNFVIYNSAYTNQGPFLGFRSGTGIIFSNMLVGCSSLVNMANFRSTESLFPWGGANGLNPWDTNGGLVATGTYTGPTGQQWLTDSSANWTPNQWVGGLNGNTNWAYDCIDISQGGSNYNENGNLANFGIIASNGTHDIYITANHVGGIISWVNGDTYAIYKVYAALDQPGRGLSDLLADNAANSGQPIDIMTGKTNWPAQQLEPWYQWDNTNNGAQIGYSTNAGWYSSEDAYYPIIIYGRDEIDGPKPGYVPLPYPHPLDTTNSTSSFSGFNLTVVSGAGSGIYTNGAIVSISGNQTANQNFAYWSGPYIANTNQANTTLTMPAFDLTVTAYYAPYPPTGVTNVAAP